MDEKRPPEASPTSEPNSSSESAPSGGDETRTFFNLARHFQPGTIVDGRYRIERFLGMGGMGRVYLARDLELGLDVALKVIRPELLEDEEATERFKRELVLARKVSHRNVVRIHDLGEVDGLKYLTMTFIEGQSLKERLKESGPFEPERALAVFTQICEAVAAAHAEGVVHRDLKPANIMLDEEDRVFITDFGIARSLDADDMTRTGCLVGTPAYLSPEQISGQAAQAQSDIYTLGLICFEMLTGELPSAKPGQIRRRLGALEPEVPAFVGRLIEKCVAADVRLRYGSVGEILEDLENGQVRVPWRLGRPWIKYAGLSAAAALLLTAFAILALRPLFFEPTGPVAEVDSASLAVLPFADKTGAPELAWMRAAASELLISDLARQTDLRVVSADRIHQTLSDLKMEPGAYDADSVKRLSRILDADLVLQGTLTRAGSQLRADVQLQDSLKPNQPTYLKSSGAAENLFGIVEDLAGQIKQTLKISSVAGEGYTPSLACLQAHQQGAEALRAGQYDEAVRQLQQAIQLDADYLPAYLKLSEAHERLGRLEEAARVLEDAIEVESPDQRASYTVRARHARLEGELDKSIKIYERLAELFPNDPDVLFELALAREETGDFNGAVRVLEKVTQLDPNHPRAYFNLGKDTIRLGESERAIGQHLVKALSIATQLNDKRAEADALNAIGVAYERLGRYDDAIKNYNDSIALKEAVDDKNGAGTSLSNIARIHIFRGRYEQAEPILGRIMTIFQEIDNQKGIADVNNMFGVLNEDRGRFDEALDYYKRSLQLRKQLGDDRLTAQSYDNVGYVYYLQGEYDNAHVYWQQALELKESIGEEAGVILSLQNMGFLQVAQGALDDALKSFLDALNRGRSIKFENAVAVSLGNLASIYQSQGRYQPALESYQEALDLLRMLEDKKGLAEYTKLMGDALLELNALDQAGEKLEEAQALAREIRSGEIIADLHVLSGRLLRKRGDLAAADRRLSEALEAATRQNYQKTLVRARVEEALLRMDQERYDEAERTLTLARREAQSIGNLMLAIQIDQAFVTLSDRRKENRRTIQLVAKILPAARKMGLKPALCRLRAVEGAAFLRLGDQERATESFRQGLKFFQEIEKVTADQYQRGLKESHEVRQLFQGLQLVQAGQTKS